MKNTKRHSATPRRPSASGANATPPAPTAAPPSARRPTAAPPKPQAPTLATAARCFRATADQRDPPTTSTKQPKAPAKRTSTKSTTAKRTSTREPSLVHDAVRRAFHAVSGGGLGDDTPSDVSECERLRGELVRAMADHQRQADEIVALRALARSLKEEVEAMQDAAQVQDVEQARSARLSPYGRAPTNHEFFQLDAHVDALRDENKQLRGRVETIEREKRELEEVLDREIPRCELLATQARAELESTASQLHDEQHENDRLRSEIAYYKARSRSLARAQRPVRSAKQLPLEGLEIENDQENDHGRANTRVAREPVPAPAFDESLRESLMSSMASLSVSAASAFSNQLQDDVETLKSELRRLHRSIDASIMTAARGNVARNRESNHRQSHAYVDQEEKKVEMEEEEKAAS